ncbi:hypothetical protein [Aeropyrum camini]|uniref:Predicted hydrolase or acyltransferase n=1 Tax=Aeropyrum camini SY1 = JCM 12091 TaxID=1198449 RepID=U3TCV9_9CREN|nr:hypothetical protein [Aeropyrum camini]BAN90261.1 predicted hydrolase or acyltransferase [Aeropyrum camini SY1 = JCM 12091]
MPEAQKSLGEMREWEMTIKIDFTIRTNPYRLPQIILQLMPILEEHNLQHLNVTAEGEKGLCNNELDYDGDLDPIYGSPP